MPSPATPAAGLASCFNWLAPGHIAPAQEAAAKPLETLTHDTEREREVEQGKLQRVEALEVSLTHFKRVGQEQHKCPTCDRALHGQEEVQAFVAKQVGPGTSCSR